MFNTLLLYLTLCLTPPIFLNLIMVAPSCIVTIPTDSHFTLHNIPFGIFRTAHHPPRPCTAIGEFIVNLEAVAQAGLFDTGLLKGKAREVFSASTLNPFMALGRQYWREARRTIQSLLTSGESPLEGDAKLKAAILLPMGTVEMVMPITVGDYTDFYSSKEHATNVGVMFRGPTNALQPNW